MTIADSRLSRLARASFCIAATAVLVACTGSQQAPSFAFTELDGTRRSSESLAGKVVVVNFWATTCAPCIVEMPQFVALHRRLGGRGLETLAIAMRHDPPASVAAFAESQRLPFPVVIDNTGAIASAFGAVAVTPTTVVIDRQGRVAHRFVGMADFPELDALLDRLLSAG